MDIQERQPLLNSSTHSNVPSHSSQQEPLSLSSDDFPTPYPHTLPGTPYRKSINWSSAYILVVSQVIGSGIFATPGSIVRSAGSIGLTLLVWLVGTIISACGLAVSMEFGCMLPRSGGTKVKRICRIAESCSAKFAYLPRCTSSIPIPDRGFSHQAL
jgi:amino acid permease